MGGQENVPAGHLEPTGTAWNMERTVQGKSMTSLESFQGLEWLGRPLLPCLLEIRDASWRHGGAYSSSANGSPVGRLPWFVRDES